MTNNVTHRRGIQIRPRVPFRILIVSSGEPHRLYAPWHDHTTEAASRLENGGSLLGGGTADYVNEADGDGA
jgi:hypothetical protein